MIEEYTEDELAYLKHVERIENIMVVLDDALEVVCEPDERLAVIESVCSALGVEAESFELWQHVVCVMKEHEVVQ